MRRDRWLIGALIGVLVATLLVYYVPRLSWEQYTKHIGAHGAAAEDSTYAAQLLVARLGYPVHKMDDPAKLADLPQNATLYLSSLIAEPLAARMEPRIVDWIRRGGHLVIAVPGPEQTNRFTSSLGLHRLGRHRPREGKSELIELEGLRLAIQFSDCDVFELDAKPLWSGTVPSYSRYANQHDRTADDDGDKETPDSSEDGPAEMAVHTPALAVARWPLGKGWVTAVCNDWPLSNTGLGRFDHAELAARVLLNERDAAIYFAPQTEYPKLLPWLYARAPEALAGAAALVLLALWRAIPRFGPLRSESVPQRPGLTLHLSAVGRFHLDRGDWQTLLAALREEVHRLARQSGGPQGLPEIAECAGLPLATLETAMTDTAVCERREFMRTATLLAHAIDVLQAQRPAQSSKTVQKKPAP